MKSKKQAADPEPFGDYFLVLNAAGAAWTGSSWSADWAQGLRFDAEPDPYRLARAASEALGPGCVPLYVPRPGAWRVGKGKG